MGAKEVDLTTILKYGGLVQKNLLCGSTLYYNQRLLQFQVLWGQAICLGTFKGSF
jgi:hypothetical protein